MQANAAYVPIDKFNDTTDPDEHIKLAIEYYRGIKSQKVDIRGEKIDIYEKAKDYIRAWRYQFGNK